MKEKSYKWGFASAMLATLIFVIMYHMWRVIIGEAIDGTGASQVLSVGPFHTTREMVVAIGLVFAVVLFLTCIREVKSFFLSIKVGVTLVLLSLLACTIGVMIPQLDDQEDPTTAVDLQHAVIADPDEYFPAIKTYSAGALELIDLENQTKALRVSSAGSSFDAEDNSLFVDVPVRVRKNPPQGSGYIISLDYAVGRRGGLVEVELWDKHGDSPAHKHSSNFIKFRNYAQKHEGTVIEAESEPSGDEGGQWFLKRQMRISRGLAPLNAGDYWLRFIVKPTPQRRTEDAQLPLELVIGRIRLEEFKHFTQYRAFAEAEAQLFYYIGAPWRMYGIGNKDDALSEREQRIAQRERQRAADEIEVLQANADLYENRAVRNRSIELELATSSIPKTFISDRDMLENEDFYRAFFAFASVAQWNLAYKSYWFEGLMLLLFISVLTQTLRFKLRELMTWQRVGFFITHVGIMVTLLGGAVSRYANRLSNGATRGVMNVTTNERFTSEKREAAGASSRGSLLRVLQASKPATTAVLREA